MDSTDVLTSLRNELVDRGIVRYPDDAGADVPLFIEPDGGPPAPGERDAPEDHATLMVSMGLDVELGAGPFEASRRRIVILFRYRSKTTAGLITARRVDSAIRDALADRPDGGLGWTMDDGGDLPVLVLSSTVYGGLGVIGETDDKVTDQAARYLFEVLNS